MLAYFSRRLLLIIPTFIGVTLLVFALTRFVPGGPVEQMIAQMQSQSMESGGGNQQGSQTLSDEQIAELNAFYGLDKPIFEAYTEWLGKLVQLDLGESTRYYEPVWGMIKERLPVSLFYGLMTFLISYLISIPLGILKAMKHGSRFDNVSSVMVFIGYALPNYVVGVFLISFFAFHLDWFPMGDFVSDDFDDLLWPDKIADLFSHAVLPLFCYIIGDFAILTMTMKNNLLENLAADYVKTAIAKGLPFQQAVRKHALRNSLIPIASHLGNVVSVFVAGSFLIEVVFNIDGIGLLGYESIIERDYPVVMGILAMSSLLLMFGNILSDMCVAIVDPRVKFGS
ncbi:ABC transporter permease subunit [Photobacterium alginatilyticum]|uniref:ABC transporter permease subunit n=1 Tax=Photobacterium alginatilyticum TaxID=1775171 RepID=A0ABW9YR22_9GAMM|nr:ABC transporter permease subunit [Photobacterium alginatilyticum]NBI56145.1 ABC transporter permease subunit [Photobacterium alginatilyticum]